MCNPLAAMAVAAGASATISGINAIKQSAAQRKAARVAERNARLAKEAQTRALNKENANQPDVAALLKRAKQMSTQGLSSTFLTGAKGINPAALKGFLGSQSLLGGNG